MPDVPYSVDTFDVMKRSPWLFLCVQAMTCARVGLVVPMVMMLYSDYHIDVLFAFGLSIGAAQLDWMDGWCARRWHVVSRFGRFADPIADKLFFLTALIALNKFLKLQLIIVIVAVEVALIVHRVVVLIGANTADVSANAAGKSKAVLQNIVVSALILGQFLEPYDGSSAAFFVDWLAHTLLYASLGLSFISLGVHLHRHGIVRLH